MSFLGGLNLDFLGRAAYLTVLVLMIEYSSKEIKLDF